MDRKRRNSKSKWHNIVCRTSRKRTDTNLPHVEITQEALDALTSYRQMEGNERPGVLVGVYLGNNRYRITTVSPPMPKGKSSGTGCERDADKANAFIQEQYEQSGHTRIYLGEWHTHPEDNPSPSYVDHNSILQIAFLPDNPLPFVILCIVGRVSNYWGCLINKQLHTLLHVKIL